MKKILITGSNGFIGSALKSKLISLRHEILELNATNGNIADKEVFNKYGEENIFHIFHLAAKTFVPDSWADTFEFYNTNVIGTENVLEFCRKKEISLTFVSAYLYGKPEKLPISENDRVAPNNPYAHSKYLAEQLCEFYAREFGIKITIVRPFNVYGIGQDEKFLIPLIIRQALFEEVIKVKDLYPKRDYIFLDDLVDALILSMNSASNFCIYNIGSGCSLSVKDIIETVKEILSTDKPVISESTIRKNEISDVVADISKARNELNWFPRHSFNEGISKIINYYRNGVK